MAWGDGPGEITSIDFGGTLVDGGLIEDFSKDTRPDEFRAAAGIQAERGSVLVTGRCKVIDVSAINALNTLMTGRAEQTVVITYTDAGVQTITGCIIRVKPVLHLVTDACRVRIAADGTANTSLTTNFTDLGITLGEPSVETGFNFEGTDGCGRPYYSGVKIQYMFTLPGTSSISPYALLDAGSHRGVKNQVAIGLPDGNHIVVTDGRAYYTYASEDSAQPRAVNLKIRATGANWSDILGYTDGGATPTNESWSASSPTLAADYFGGAEVEFVGFGTAETNIITWS